MSEQGASPPPPAADAGRELRRVLGRFATGVTVVTTWHGERAHGMTANAFTSVSLDPPLVLTSIDNRAATGQRVRESGAFAVNVLSDAQEYLAKRFAGAHREMADPFADLRCRPGVGGAPLLPGVVAWIDCRLYAAYEGGDHTLFLGRIEAFGQDETKKPLLFYGGAFHTLPDRPLDENVWTWFWPWY